MRISFLLVLYMLGWSIIHFKRLLFTISKFYLFSDMLCCIAYSADPAKIPHSVHHIWVHTVTAQADPSLFWCWFYHAAWLTHFLLFTTIVVCSLFCLCTLIANIANNMVPYQIAPLGALWPELMVFASVIK